MTKEKIVLGSGVGVISSATRTQLHVYVFMIVQALMTGSGCDVELQPQHPHFPYRFILAPAISGFAETDFTGEYKPSTSGTEVYLDRLLAQATWRLVQTQQWFMTGDIRLLFHYYASS